MYTRAAPMTLNKRPSLRFQVNPMPSLRCFKKRKVSGKPPKQRKGETNKNFRSRTKSKGAAREDEPSTKASRKETFVAQSAETARAIRILERKKNKSAKDKAHLEHLRSIK